MAVKIQRPSVLETVSKDLYVLRRAAEVYQGLIERFAPQQRTNYVALLNEWAVGFYTELDFLNEACNQKRIQALLKANNVTGIYIPNVYTNLCTRRVLVSEWIDGQKLSSCSQQQINDLIPQAQEAFLTQLLQVGLFHADPHPGNIMYMHEPRGEARMALLDFGLVASIRQEDRDAMVSALIHLANRDYASLVDDFVGLYILPIDCDRAKVIPLMDKALTPYVKGGGAQRYEAELRKMYSTGGFQAMTQDALTVLNDVPFSIPPYFALLGRAIVTLEGVALTGNPNYGLIMEAYPFVARKLLKEDRPVIQQALQQLLYSEGSGEGLQAARLSVLLNSALGVVKRSDEAAFVDLDTVPENAVSWQQSLAFLLRPEAASLRSLLVTEAVVAGDVLARQAARKFFQRYLQALPRLLPFLPETQSLRLPFLLPRDPALFFAVAKPSLSLSTLQEQWTPVLLTPNQLLEAGAPRLSREEELYALSLIDLFKQTLGTDAASVLSGDALLDRQAASNSFRALYALAREPVVSELLAQRPQLQLLYQRTLLPFIQLTGRLASAGTNRNKGSVAINNSPEGQKSIIDELVTTLMKLSSEERVILQESVSAVVGGMAKCLLQRLQPLATSKQHV